MMLMENMTARGVQCGQGINNTVDAGRDAIIETVSNLLKEFKARHVVQNQSDGLQEMHAAQERVLQVYKDFASELAKGAQQPNGEQKLIDLIDKTLNELEPENLLKDQSLNSQVRSFTEKFLILIKNIFNIVFGNREAGNGGPVVQRMTDCRIRIDQLLEQASKALIRPLLDKRNLELISANTALSNAYTDNQEKLIAKQKELACFKNVLEENMASYETENKKLGEINHVMNRLKRDLAAAENALETAQTEKEIANVEVSIPSLLSQINNDQLNLEARSKEENGLVISQKECVSVINQLQLKFNRSQEVIQAKESELVNSPRRALLDKFERARDQFLKNNSLLKAQQDAFKNNSVFKKPLELLVSKSAQVEFESKEGFVRSAKKDFDKERAAFLEISKQHLELKQQLEDQKQIQREIGRDLASVRDDKQRCEQQLRNIKMQFSVLSSLSEAVKHKEVQVQRIKSTIDQVSSALKARQSAFANQRHALNDINGEIRALESEIEILASNPFSPDWDARLDYQKVEDDTKISDRVQNIRERMAHVRDAMGIPIEVV